MNYMLGAKEHGRYFLCHRGILTPKKAIIPPLKDFLHLIQRGKAL